MKDYMKPEAELIVLMAEETVATQLVDDGFVDGEIGMESSIW